ncbi:hypothetical protein [Mycolicibacterium phlei]|uniref:hypothetical protein n=1 Tax=Mycolicibacterium phlei TaxID=1771 RepID=UPI001E609080|nr:hypothetical protein [Mycolicibacterium phlei]MBF4191578.1 hypothetical protein [Mycolicibacterium phlei]
MTTTAHDSAAVAVITDWVRREVGGRVIAIARQARWRPTWFVDVEREGEILALVVRGERGAGIPMQFPLRHEMSLQRVMREQSVLVPAVYGWIDELPAYVMDRADGHRISRTSL